MNMFTWMPDGDIRMMSLSGCFAIYIIKVEKQKDRLLYTGRDMLSYE